MIAMPVVNYASVLVAAIVMLVVGFVWYAKPVFGKKWAALSGLSMDGPKQGMMKGMIGMFIASLIASWVLAMSLKAWQVTSVTEAFMGAFFLWLGFVATTHIGSVLFEKKPLALFAINAVHYLVGLALAGAVLVLMP